MWKWLRRLWMLLNFICSSNNRANDCDLIRICVRSVSAGRWLDFFYLVQGGGLFGAIFFHKYFNYNWEAHRAVSFVRATLYTTTNLMSLVGTTYNAYGGFCAILNLKQNRKKRTIETYWCAGGPNNRGILCSHLNFEILKKKKSIVVRHKKGDRKHITHWTKL